MQMDGAAGGHGYQVVSVALPTDLVETLVRRVGPNGLSLYITQALRRQEPLAALLEFHRLTAAALNRAAAEMESWGPPPQAITPAQYYGQG